MNKYALIITFVLISSTAMADEYVNGFYRSNGTYVQPYHRTAPDGNVWNNYSTQGNVNPYTGQPGTVNPYPQPQQINPYNQNNPYNTYNPYAHR